MVLFKGNVRIQVTDDFVLEALDSFIAGIESSYLGCKAAVTPLGHLEHFDPRILREIAAYDFWGPVCRSIVHDHPFHRQDGLMNHRFDRLLDERLFIASRGDQYVGGERTVLIRVIRPHLRRAGTDIAARNRHVATLVHFPRMRVLGQVRRWSSIAENPVVCGKQILNRMLPREFLFHSPSSEFSHSLSFFGPL